MITTLRKEAFLIKDLLSGGNASTDSQIDERDIMMVYRQKMREVMKLVVYDGLNEGDRSQIAIYIAFYGEVEVKDDSLDESLYCDLPSGFMHLPRNKGIVHVAPTDDPSVEIFRFNNPYVASNLPVSKMEGRATYYQEGLRLKFRDENWGDWEHVNIKLLIPAPDSIGENDPLPIIANQQGEISRLVIEHFKLRVPVDVLNDGNPDRGVIK